MKKKYIVKEINGWHYEGKYYLNGTTAELTDVEYEALKDQVKLEPVVLPTAKQP